VAPGVRRRLLLVTPPRTPKPSFEAIRRQIAARAPDIDCRVIEDAHWRARRWRLATLPTLVFSAFPLRKLRPVRGSVCQGRRLPKSEEYRALEAAGVPVPRWALVGPGEEPDLSGFSDYVVSKPDLGWLGAEVKIRRRSRVRYKPPEQPLPPGADRTIVQEFVYTGPWPVSYRVTSLFGRALFCCRVEADRARRPLASPDAFGGSAGSGLSIVASGRGCVFSLCDDREVIALGTEAHRAFPDIPLLGVDVVRDARTGRRAVVEANAHGYVWHLDSEIGRRVQREHGIDFESQFGAIGRAAEVLIEQTRARAQ